MSQPPLKFSPVNAYPIDYEMLPETYRKKYPTVPWVWNPWTGKPRHELDIKSDPTGLAIYLREWGESAAHPIDKALQPARDTQVAGDHYKTMGVQPWDVVDSWPLEQRIGYYRGGALKYLMRMGSKDQSAQEIAKGKHYMEKLLEVLNES